MNGNFRRSKVPEHFETEFDIISNKLVCLTSLNFLLSYSKIHNKGNSINYAIHTIFLKNTRPTQCYKTSYGCNLRTFKTSWSVCPCQAFPA